MGGMNPVGQAKFELPCVRRRRWLFREDGILRLDQRTFGGGRSPRLVAIDRAQAFQGVLSLLDLFILFMRTLVLRVKVVVFWRRSIATIEMMR